MRVRFGDDKLERMEAEATYTWRYDAVVAGAFRKRMQQLRAAPDERALYALKSLHFEKLEGTRAHQRSIRLNLQWRLILEFEESACTPKTVVVVGIEDYH